MQALGVDVGGTFTDFVGIDSTGRAYIHKQLTTAADPSLSVLTGSAAVAERAGTALDELQRIVHGTTLVANSLIERRGARTALVTTVGYRDAIEIGREARYDLYDLRLERPAPLVPRSLRFEVRERIRGDGSVLEPLAESECLRVAALLREHEIESVAVCLLNSYANPEHERRLAKAIAGELPDVDVTLSSEVAPEWREFERSSTAAANAFVRPQVRRYLSRLEEGFASNAARSRLNVVLSQGGMTSAAVAADLAVQLVESGPAGGALAAAYVGRQLGLDELIAFDMGGTTTKACLIANGAPLRVSELEVARVARFKRGSGLPLLIPALELVEIGAGGGSIGHTDALGLLRVGPESAGADPGPACYGHGGRKPTVTDADLVLGLLDPDYFLGGEIALDRDAAEAALAAVGGELGLGVQATAQGIFDIVNSQMSLALQTHVIERGEDPRAFTMVAFGGAGPVHAYEVARRLGIRTVVCPPAAGVASAVGFLVAPPAVDLVRTFPAKLRAVDWTGVAERYDEMEAEVRVLLAASADEGSLVLERLADMRYAGQGYTVSVHLPDGPLDSSMTDLLHLRFTETYHHRFGAKLESAEPEALHWRLRARVEAEQQRFAFESYGSNGAAPRPRQAYFPEANDFITCLVYDRHALEPDVPVAGPALIQERETTVAVGPGGTACADSYGNLTITIGEG
jgi:N-methylhydantoinase A